MGKCWAQIYVDPAAAFDRIIRELAMSTGTTNRAKISELQRAHSLPDELVEIILNMAAGKEKCAFTAAGMSNELLGMVADFHDGTWFTTGHDMPAAGDPVLQTDIGARQGCPLGACCYNPVYEHVLKKVENELVARGITGDVKYDPGAPPWRVPHYQHCDDNDLQSASIADVDFVDDLAWMIMHDSAAQLLANTATLLDVVTDIFTAHALTVNLKKGKTEMVM